MFPPSLPVQQGITDRIFLGNERGTVNTCSWKIREGKFCCLAVRESKMSFVGFHVLSCFISLFSNAKSFRILFWSLIPSTSENGKAGPFSSFANATLIMCFAVGSKKDTDVCIIWGYEKEGVLILLPQHQWQDSPPRGRWEMHRVEVSLWAAGRRISGVQNWSIWVKCSSVVCVSVSISHFWVISKEIRLAGFPSQKESQSLWLAWLPSTCLLEVHMVEHVQASAVKQLKKVVLYAKSYMKAESKLWPRDRILLQVLFLKIRSCFRVSRNSLGTEANTEPSSPNPKISVWSHFSISVWSHRVIDAFLNCISISKQREYLKSLSAKHKITLERKNIVSSVFAEKSEIDTIQYSAQVLWGTDVFSQLWGKVTTWFTNAPQSILSCLTFSQPLATFPYTGKSSNWMLCDLEWGITFSDYFFYFHRNIFKKQKKIRRPGVAYVFGITFVPFQLSRCCQREENWREENILYCSDLMPDMLLLSLSVYSCCNSSEDLFVLKGCTFCMAGLLSSVGEKPKSNLLECFSRERGGLQGVYWTLWNEKKRYMYV